MLTQLVAAASWSDRDLKTATSSRVVYANVAKNRFTFVESSQDLFSILDVARVADVLVLIAAFDGSGTESLIDAVGLLALTSLRALGSPTVVCCLQDIRAHMSASAVETGLPFREIQKYLESAVSADMRVVNGADTDQLIRLISTTVPRDVSWRSIRSYMLPDSVEIAPDIAATDVVAAPLFSVKIRGYLRGNPLHIHSLGHFPYVGVGKIERIEVPMAGGPCEARHGVAGAGESPCMVLQADPEKQDSIVLEAAGAGVSGEQTWPDEEEMGGTSSAAVGMVDKSRRVAPKHVSRSHGHEASNSAVLLSQD